MFTETNKERIDAILYQAMFDETIRLRKCRNRKEREKIRAFIMEAYQLFAERNLENENQDIFQGCIPDESKEIRGYTRIVVETDEDNPKTIAEITKELITPADGYRVRLTSEYD